MGRKPLPTAVKRLRGNPGKRRLPENEPKPSGTATCPRWLSAEARKEWRRLAPGLVAMGMLTAVDRAPFAAYCQTYARWVDAEQKIDQHGQVIRTQAGNAIQNPFVGIANRAKDLLAKFASEFGFTPSSRSRLQVAPQADTDDGWDDFLRDTNQLDSDVRNLQ